MGKKDKKKNKNKISGPVKTALKTEKKLNVKQKKELAAIGEDDIEKIVAEIEKEEARRQCIKEVVVDTPLRRVNFTLTAHPFKDELIMLGGEFHDGRQTIVYGDMFIYNINKREWTLVKAPGAPPPRCGHQAVATANHGGELWVFGGEFTSPSESQFYHYRDLWSSKWPISQKRAQNGAREETANSVAPTPRSGCILLPTPDNKVLLYGGYSKEKVKKNIELGCIHDDMFLLTQADKNDVTKYKWVSVKQTGIRISPRCGATATLIQPAANQAFVFGGVYDDDGDDEEEDLCGTFYNDLFVLDLEKLHWRVVTLTGKRETTLTGGTEKRRRRRRNQREESCEEAEQSNDSDEEVIEDLSNSVQSTVIVDDDGIFTVTIGSTEPSTSSSSSLQPISTVTSDKETKFLPLPRINAGMATKHNILYLYGGIMEEGDRQYTFSDFYSLDCRRLDEWKTLIADDLSSQTWFDSSESSEDNENEDNSEKEESDDNKSVNINVEN
ncbi:Kelch domain-containing protein [Temnothorax longispinosus]|uniref:Kelch domain-containing protein n=1 Tax=Temnothorax longispinosus TaxID=300112 RepID=A0A4S2KXE3_9HYME|nr:Kelch domain-containing protein [Temnothorax longispinosus]